MRYRDRTKLKNFFLETVLKLKYLFFEIMTVWNYNEKIVILQQKQIH